jgi:hypothetical protein
MTFRLPPGTPDQRPTPLDAAELHAAVGRTIDALADLRRSALQRYHDAFGAGATRGLVANVEIDDRGRVTVPRRDWRDGVREN